MLRKKLCQRIFAYPNKIKQKIKNDAPSMHRLTKSTACKTKTRGRVINKSFYETVYFDQNIVEKAAWLLYNSRNLSLY
jgi:hypothetical protein